jgi:hypothetical protein
VDALYCAASHKCAKGSLSTRNDRRKVQHISVGQAISDSNNNIGNSIDNLAAALHEAVTTTPASEPDKYSIALSTVTKDEALSQKEMDDTFEIFMNHPWVADTYVCIPDVSAHNRFLRKRLNEFQIEKLHGITRD